MANVLARDRARLLLAVVPLALLAACGSPAAPAGDEATSALRPALPGAEAQSKLEQALATCMEAQGFEYVAAEATAVGPQVVGLGERPSAEFTARSGYGISTTGTAAAGGQQDPNASSRSRLSAGEQREYDRVMFGAASETDANGLASDGCLAQAARAAGQALPDLSALGAGTQELDQRIAADPAMVKATAAWSGCMRDKGFDYASPTEALDDVTQRLEALGLPGSGEPSTDQAARLTELQEDERATATADLDCYVRHLEKTDHDVRRAAEQAFLEANADVFSAGSGKG